MARIQLIKGRLNNSTEDTIVKGVYSASVFEKPNLELMSRVALKYDRMCGISRKDTIYMLQKLPSYFHNAGQKTFKITKYPLPVYPRKKKEQKKE